MASIFQNKRLVIDDPRKAEVFSLSIEELIPLFENEDYLERGYAAQAAGRLQSKKALPGLLELVNDEEPEVRADALVSIMEIDGKKCHEVFTNALEDEEEFVKLVALEAHSRFPDKSAEKPLLKTFEQNADNPEISLLAAIALANIKHERAIPRLMTEITEGKDRYSALNALRLYDSLNADVLEKTGKFHKRWFIHTLEKLEAAAILHKNGDSTGTECIQKKLYSNRMLEKSYSIELVCKLHIEDSLSYVRDVASDEQHYFCPNALNALVAIKDKQGLEMACNFADRAINPDIRSDAIRILYYNKAPLAQEKIKKALGGSELDDMQLELKNMLKSFEDK